jgi:hypothetical protein
MKTVPCGPLIVTPPCVFSLTIVLRLLTILLSNAVVGNWAVRVVVRITTGVLTALTNCVRGRLCKFGMTVTPLTMAAWFRMTAFGMFAICIMPEGQASVTGPPSTRCVGVPRACVRAALAAFCAALTAAAAILIAGGVGQAFIVNSGRPLVPVIALWTGGWFRTGTGGL